MNHNYLSVSSGFWPAVIRPPYGVTSNKTSKMIEKNTKMRTVLWNFDPSRKEGKKPKGTEEDNSDIGSLIPALIVKNIEDNVRIGDIIHFREGNADIVIALPAIINCLHKQGYELLTISQMLSYPDDKPH